MSADDQQFLDVLSSIPNEVRKYSGEVAAYVDERVDKLADVLRSRLAASSWIPDAIRPSPRPPPLPPAASSASSLPSSALVRARHWAARHRLVVGLLALAAAALAYRSYRRTALRRKTRRARRSRHGGRAEVVVVAGSPALPLARSLALDLERKGFVVFVVCGSADDEALVRNLSRPDIRPLAVDITDPPSAGAAVERFAHYLRTPHAPAPGVKRHHHSLTAVLLIPSLSYQTSPIATIPPSSFADLFNTHLLHPILTVQAFLPLLTAARPAAASAAALRRQEGVPAPKGARLHALHHLVHQPAVPRARGHRLLRPVRLHRRARRRAAPARHPRHPRPAGRLRLRPLHARRRPADRAAPRPRPRPAAPRRPPRSRLPRRWPGPRPPATRTAATSWPSTPPRSCCPARPAACPAPTPARRASCTPPSSTSSTAPTRPPSCASGSAPTSTGSSAAGRPAAWSPGCWASAAWTTTPPPTRTPRCSRPPRRPPAPPGAASPRSGSDGPELSDYVAVPDDADQHDLVPSWRLQP